MSSVEMGKIVYREFLGSRLLLTVLCLTGVGIPLAIIYVLENTVTVEESIKSPSEFLDAKREQLKWPRSRRGPAA